jgi:hypothetical protein
MRSASSTVTASSNPFKARNISRGGVPNALVVLEEGMIADERMLEGRAVFG